MRMRIWIGGERERERERERTTVCACHQEIAEVIDVWLGRPQDEDKNGALLRTTSKPAQGTGNQSSGWGLGGGVPGPLNDSSTW